MKPCCEDAYNDQYDALYGETLAALTDPKGAYNFAGAGRSERTERI